MAKIEVSVVINRPVQEVWDFFGDLRNSPYWTRSGSLLRQTSAGPMGVGATIESGKLVLGRFDIKSQSLVVTKYEPPERVVLMATVQILGPTTTGFTFERVEQGTRLTRTTEGEFGGLMGFVVSLVLGFLRSSHQIELGNIKRLVEATARDQKVDVPTPLVPMHRG
jgi:uncharacterized protein YndB with AHSA1/START domain